MRLLVVLAWLLMASPALAEDAQLRIAILPFDNALPRQYDALKDGLPDIITACFTAASTPAEIVDRSEIEGMTAEATQNFDVKNIHLKSATHLLRGSIAPQGDGVVVNLLLYDLAAAKLVASAEAAGGTGDISAAACKAVDALAEKFSRLKPQQTGTETSEQEEQGRLMLQGMGFYYNGAFGQATPAFMKLLKETPDNAAARYWLGMSYKGAGMDDAAKIEFQKFADQFPHDPRHAEVEGYLNPPKEK